MSANPHVIVLDSDPLCYDLVLTNESHLVDRIQISEPLGKSDHAVLEFDFLSLLDMQVSLDKSYCVISPKPISRASPCISQKQYTWMVALTNSSHAFSLLFTKQI